MRSKLLTAALMVVLVLSSLTLFACAKTNQASTGAYILSDKATYLSYKNNEAGDKIPNLTLLYENDDNMKNTYSMIAVDADGEGFASPVALNEIGADCFIKWMSLESTRALIAGYGKASYGESLFYLIEKSDVVYSGDDYTYAKSGATDTVISISTTTSVNDSGLLGYLEPIFEEATGFDVQIASAGTGAAINAAKAGNADLLLVHSKAQEEAFIDGNFARTVGGFSAERISFMYNYFVLIGPKADPAGAKDAATVVDAFKAIKAGAYTFVSRGDNSGTQTKETALWKAAGVEDIYYDATAKSAYYNPEYTWFVSTGSGMGASLLVANEKATSQNSSALNSLVK